MEPSNRKIRNIKKIMCGIVGIFNYKKVSRKFMASMSKKINHRGPDSNDIYLEKKNNLGLASLRLAIVDASKKGNQPTIQNYDARKPPLRNASAAARSAKFGTRSVGRAGARVKGDAPWRASQASMLLLS